MEDKSIQMKAGDNVDTDGEKKESKKKKPSEESWKGGTDNFSNVGRTFKEEGVVSGFSELAEGVVGGAKTLSNITNSGESENNPEGVPQVTEGDAIEGTKTTADDPDTEIVTDDLMTAIGGVGAGKLSSTDAGEALANGVNKTKDLVGALSGGSKSNNPSNSQENDKVIDVEKTKGDGSDKDSGIDTLSYESIGKYGLPSTGEYIIDRETGDTTKNRPLGSNYYFKKSKDGKLSF